MKKEAKQSSKATMKKFAILFFITSFFIQFSNAQEWAPIGSIWHYDKSTLSGEMGYITIKSIKDTSIQGKTCKVLEKKGYLSHYNFPKTDTFLLGYEYTYADSGKVYYYRQGSFYVLYNFNANKGDTWEVKGQAFFCNKETSIVVVDSVTYVTVNNKSVKKLWVSAKGTNNWRFDGPILEDIGSTGYMFPEPYCVADANEGGWLRCYNDGVSTLYKDITEACDYMPYQMKRVWHYGYSENPMSGAEQGFLRVEHERDVMIAGKKCAVLKRTYRNSKGILRYESDQYLYEANDKVYQYIYNNFYLLYDFTAKKGDTIKVMKQYITASKDSTFNVIVDSTGTKIIDGIPFKFYTAKNNIMDAEGWMFSGTFIEKMGALQYMFPQNQLGCDAGCYNGLRCYADQQVFYQVDPNVYCEKIVTGQEELLDGTGFINVFPNPTREWITIKLTNDSKDAFIGLYNIQGQRLNESNLAIKKSPEALEINLSELQPGMYILRTLINGRIINSRVFKAN